MQWIKHPTGRVDGLTMEELESYPGNDRPGTSGEKKRYYCPIHGGDRQRSFELRPNGGWKCYACGAWGFLVEAREEYLRNMRVDRFYGGKFGRKNGGGILTPSRPLKARRSENRGQSGGVNKPSAIEPAAADLDEKMARFREALIPGSLAARYLEWRGISLETAKRFGLGYAAYGEWPHYNKKGKPVRQWKYGRLVVPHTDPGGRIINLYGRAIGGDDVPKEVRHSHLRGPRGVFNAPAMAADTVFITEGAFDALALIEAGYPTAVAVFGINGLRLEWLKAKTVVFAMDQDEAGAEWRKMAARVRMMGKKVYWIEPAAYQREKDLAAAWAKYRALPIGEIPEPTKPEPVINLPISGNWAGPGRNERKGSDEGFPPPGQLIVKDLLRTRGQEEPAGGEWAPATGGTNREPAARVSGPEESEEAPPGHWARREEVDRWLDAAAAIMAEICEAMEETAVSAEKMKEAAFKIDPEEAEEYDRKASRSGWLILGPGEAYERRLTRNHSVFLFRGPGGWEAIKSKWAPGERTPEKEMTFATGTFDRVMKEAERYIRWFETLPGMRRPEQPTGTKSAATAETTGQRGPEPEQEGKAETADETTQGELFMGF